MRSPPATLLEEELRPLVLNPSGESKSCTAILGTWGTGSFRWDPSGLLIMSDKVMPGFEGLAVVGAGLGNWASGAGSRGVNAGVVWPKDSCRKGGSS